MKTVATADDLVIMIKTESIAEAGYIANVELDKMSALANQNKIRFNKNYQK